jgi:hypothetical protein
VLASLFLAAAAHSIDCLVVSARRKKEDGGGISSLNAAADAGLAALLKPSGLVVKDSVRSARSKKDTARSGNNGVSGLFFREHNSCASSMFVDYSNSTDECGGLNFGAF